MKKQVLVAALIGVFWAAGLSSSEAARDESDQNIQDFVRQLFVDTLPWEKIKQFTDDDEAVEKLSRMLVEDCGIQERLDGKDRRSPFCSTVAVMLSILGGGDDKVRADVTNFIEQDQSLAFKSTKDALMALGYWVNITENKNPGDPGVTQAINDLVSCITTADNGSPGHDKDGNKVSLKKTKNPTGGQKIQTTLQCSLPNTAERKHVRRSAILGLALSGSQQPKVKTTLTALLDEAKVGTSFRALITEALDAHNRIADLGLACYYARKSQECQDNIKKRDDQNKQKPNPDQVG